MEFRILGSIEVVENGDGPIPLGEPNSSERSSPTSSCAPTAWYRPTC